MHLLIDLDRVVGHLIFRRQLEFHLGSFADLEDEFKFGPVLEIEVAEFIFRSAFEIRSAQIRESETDNSISSVLKP